MAAQTLERTRAIAAVTKILFPIHGEDYANARQMARSFFKYNLSNSQQQWLMACAEEETRLIAAQSIAKKLGYDLRILPGYIVRIKDLQNRRDLNGQRARVQRFEDIKCRWKVKTTDALVNVLPANLEICVAEMPASKPEGRLCGDGWKIYLSLKRRELITLASVGLAPLGEGATLQQRRRRRISIQAKVMSLARHQFHQLPAEERQNILDAPPLKRRRGSDGKWSVAPKEVCDREDIHASEKPKEWRDGRKFGPRQKRRSQAKIIQILETCCTDPNDASDLVLAVLKSKPAVGSFVRDALNLKASSCICAPLFQNLSTMREAWKHHPARVTAALDQAARRCGIKRSALKRWNYSISKKAWCKCAGDRTIRDGRQSVGGRPSLVKDPDMIAKVKAALAKNLQRSSNFTVVRRAQPQKGLARKLGLVFTLTKKLYPVWRGALRKKGVSFHVCRKVVKNF